MTAIATAAVCAEIDPQHAAGHRARAAYFPDQTTAKYDEIVTARDATLRPRLVEAPA